MKQKFFLAAMALVAFASCSDENFVGDNSPNGGQNGAITFNSGANAITRADHVGADAAALMDNKFVFAGTKGTSPSTFVFDQYNMNYVANTAHTTESNSSNWEYVSLEPATTSSLPSGAKQAIKYWDYSTTQYDFAAYSLGKGYDADGNSATTNDITFATPSAIAAGTKSYTLQGSKNELAACYISNLVTAYNRNAVNDYGNTVNFTFRSLGAKIRVALYETIPGYSVKDVKFYTAASGDLATDGTENDVTLFAGSKVLPTGSGTMTITFPTVGWTNRTATDYNKAHVSFAATNAETDLSTTLVLADLANFAAAEGAQASGNYLGRSSSAATYAGGLVSSAGKYFTILPYETGTNLTLRIKYTLVSTDGSGEIVTVDNATAVVPAEYTKWNPNYAYTYIFKISDYTNGSTGTDGNGAIVTGLTPITFDAVVIDSEDGLQETITTVSAPSITTYQKGEVVTVKDEYLTDKVIYAIVNKDGSNQTLTPGTNAWLYTATLASGAAQSLSEASIDNALANGKYDSSAKTWTVTDANSKNLVVTLSDALSAMTAIPAADSPSGNELSITGAKFTPTAAGTYVLRYQVTAPTYDAGTLGSALTAAGVTTLDGYYTKSGEVYTQCNSATAPTAETTYYKITTPGKYMYKIIKVVAS